MSLAIVKNALQCPFEILVVPNSNVLWQVVDIVAVFLQLWGNTYSIIHHCCMQQQLAFIRKIKFHFMHASDCVNTSWEHVACKTEQSKNQINHNYNSGTNMEKRNVCENQTKCT